MVAIIRFFTIMIPVSIFLIENNRQISVATTEYVASTRLKCRRSYAMEIYISRRHSSALTGGWGMLPRDLNFHCMRLEIGFCDMHAMSLYTINMLVMWHKFIKFSNTNILSCSVAAWYPYIVYICTWQSTTGEILATMSQCDISRAQKLQWATYMAWTPWTKCIFR